MDTKRDTDARRHEKRYRHSRSSSLDSESDRRYSKTKHERREEDHQPSRREEYIGVREAKRPRNVHGRHDEGHSRQRRSRSSSPAFSQHYRDERQSRSHSTKHPSPTYHSSRHSKQTVSREGSELQASRRSRGPLPSQDASFQAVRDPSSMGLVSSGGKEVPEKQKPNFAPTGLLAAASNSVVQADGSAIALKYHEPAEARKPPAKDVWKLFVFKGSDILETIELSTRSCWLAGRELSVVDMAAEHPSISKQHAVIQFRYIEKTNEYGDKLGRVRPYLIDLESANGTSLNKEEVPASRYLELRDKDIIQFGHSTREYVLMLSPPG